MANETGRTKWRIGTKFIFSTRTSSTVSTSLRTQNPVEMNHEMNVPRRVHADTFSPVSAETGARKRTMSSVRKSISKFSTAVLNLVPS